MTKTELIVGTKPGGSKYNTPKELVAGQFGWTIRSARNLFEFLERHNRRLHFVVYSPTPGELVALDKDRKEQKL